MPSLPAVTVKEPSYISITTATGRGNITNTGDGYCDQIGFVFDLNPQDNPGNVDPDDSDYKYLELTSGSFGVGAFTHALTGLAIFTTYYIRSFAHNSAGFSYSDEIAFTTLLDIPVATWGILPKNQANNEEIEAAIDRMIVEHNDNEEAHLGPGQSLASHKAAAIIDHLVNSVISDKIKNGEVTVPKFGWDRFFVMPELESADAWNKTVEGTGAEIAPVTIGCLKLKCGTALGNKSIVFVEHPFVAVSEGRDPTLSARLDDDGEGGLDIGMAIGWKDPFVTNQRMIGIKYDMSVSRLYAFISTKN